MCDALDMNQLWQQVERTLRASTPTSVSTLRLLDVAIWIACPRQTARGWCGANRGCL